MRDIIYQVYFSIVELLREKGLVKLEHYFIDGTKIKANANQYTFVWRKATEKYEKSLDVNLLHLRCTTVKKCSKRGEWIPVRGGIPLSIEGIPLFGSFKNK